MRGSRPPAGIWAMLLACGILEASRASPKSRYPSLHRSCIPRSSQDWGPLHGSGASLDTAWVSNSLLRSSIASKLSCSRSLMPASAAGKGRRGGAWPSMQATVGAHIIDGKAIAAQIRQEISQGVQQMQAKSGVVPGLAVVQVGTRSDSSSYVRMKKKAAAEVGFHSIDRQLPETISEEDLMKVIAELNGDIGIHGILVQLPLPPHIDAAAVQEAISLEKDADGFAPANIGNLCLQGMEPLAVPCTPAGCMELLKRSSISVQGKHAVVLGRSNIVGMPMANLLTAADATVTVCHSHTQDLQAHVRRADLLVAAMGRPQAVPGSWVKPGAVVIDVGINYVDDSSTKKGYRLCGDVCFEEAVKVASAITPVPGGVGPMTIAMLLQNTLKLAKQAQEDLP